MLLQLTVIAMLALKLVFGLQCETLGFGQYKSDSEDPATEYLFLQFVNM